MTADPGVESAIVVRHAEILIIGSGFSGLGIGHRLREEGVDDFVILERAQSVGGVWEANTYPGCTCDVPSNLYSFSFAPNPDWSSTYSPQPEIRDYLRSCVDRFGLADHLRLGVEVTGATWVEERQQWDVTTSDGPWTARVLVSAVGPLTEPKLPDVPGIETFRGTIMHSARWDHDHDLSGERVASIGTGASAIQYVPRIADEVGELFVFQRSAPWVIPHDKRPFTDEERARFRADPKTQRKDRERVYRSKEVLLLGFAKFPRLMTVLSKAALKHMHSQVADPALREVLTPDYTMGCKRIVPSNEWYPALQKPHVTVVPKALAEIREHSVVDADGVEREIDTIIFATGYHVADIPFADRIRGAGGELLIDHWGGSPRAYLGAAIPGFPNFFMFLGPNTGLGHTSMVYMIEAQIEHIVHAVRALQTSASTRIEVDEAAFDAWNRDIDDRLAKSVWEKGGCVTFYQDANGRNASIWPDWTWRFRRKAATWDAKAYRLARRTTQGRTPRPAAPANAGSPR